MRQPDRPGSTNAYKLTTATKNLAGRVPSYSWAIFIMAKKTSTRSQDRSPSVFGGERGGCPIGMTNCFSRYAVVLLFL